MRQCRCRKISYIIITIALLALFCLAAGWRIYNSSSPAHLEKRLSKINQDPTQYLPIGPPQLTISPDEQARLVQIFLNLYFSPWDESPRGNDSNTKVREKVQKDINFYSQNIGWQFTSQRFSSAGIKNLIDNATLIDFPRINRPGIIVHVSQVRIFPTLLPEYNDPSIAGMGYPFDNWIASYLYPGYPVRILQESRDHGWYLIKTSSYYGWISALDVGFVSQAFIHQWKNQSFVVSVRDRAPLRNADKITLSMMHKGVLYPRMGEPVSEHTTIMTAFLDIDGNAQIRPLYAENSDLRNFPIPANPKNIAEVARTFIGGQYGWGALYELRDCSSTTADIMANFAIWLPRNSLQQSRMGKVILLKGLTAEEKFKILREQGIPFFTLVHFPGHIALYIGTQNGRAYVEQDAWGLHTQDILGRSGRAIIGRTVITPLDFGKKFSDMQSLQINAADSISLLSPDTYQDADAIYKTAWGIDK